MKARQRAAFAALTLGTLAASASLAQAHNTALPDDHAPIGVMGDHRHKQGEWMTGYRYSRMAMQGGRDGTTAVSTASVLSGFMMAPQKMDMEMHMFGLMYGVSDDLTMTLGIPYILKEMQAVTRTGMRFNNRTEGLGDLKLTALYNLLCDTQPDAHSQRITDNFHLIAGLSLPTGSTDERGSTPMAANTKLAYGMQLGSGTVDPSIGLNYVRKYADWSLGTQGRATFRLYDNDEEYRLGNEYLLTGWLAHNLSEATSVSLRLEGKRWGDIHGSDAQLNPMMSPAARTDLKGGSRLDLLLGINFIQPQGKLAGNRLALEAGLPIYQKLDGPQLETDYRLTLGWQLAF